MSALIGLPSEELMKLIFTWISLYFTLGPKPLLHKALDSLGFFIDGDHDPLKAHIVNLLHLKVALLLLLWLSFQCRY